MIARPKRAGLTRSADSSILGLACGFGLVPAIRSGDHVISRVFGPGNHTRPKRCGQT